MKLKRLEIQGFKSFAEKTEILFESGTTAIVGPNGSGKSNLSDAVRWVLGEQSAKQLRGAKMEDVIFNGTEKRKPLPWCEVSLLFDNDDRALQMDCAEVLITRRVWRSGESEYYINKASCRLKDIIELFRDTGIGKEGYSMVGQGRIDEILSTRSDDRRGIFEEAAGIVTYRVRKDEAERRMDNTRQNLERVEDILSELGDKLEPLEKQAADAKKYLELRDKLRGLELNAFLIHHEQLDERIAVCREGTEQVEAELAASEPKIQELTQRREVLGEAGVAAAEQEKEANRLVLEAARALEAQEGANNVLRERIAHIRADAGRDEAEREAAITRQKELQEQYDNGIAEAQRRREALDAQRETLLSLNEQVQKAQAEQEDAEQALETHKAKLLESMNRVSDIRTQTARLTVLQQSLQGRLDEAKQACERVAMEREAYTQEDSEARENLREACEKQNSLQLQAQELDAYVRAGSAESEKLLAALRELTGKRHETATRLGVLGEMARDYEGYQQSVRQALLYARGDKAVRGVVATLIKTPKEYERALEMVLGTALQQIVTEDEQTAKRLIEYLRTNKLGRATFLPMATVHGRTLTHDERQVLTMPGCLGVASELISFDEQYRGIVESLLGRTVIAKDLDAGIPLMRRGHHAFRLVTLEGDVMNPGGSMTGGSVQSRMTSLLSRSREIEEHQRALAELDLRLKQTQEAIDEADARRNDAKKHRNELYDLAHQAEIDAARAQAQVDRTQSDLNEYRKRREQAEKLVTQLEENLSDIQIRLSSVEQENRGSERTQEGMQEQSPVLQKRLTEARAALEALRGKETEAYVACSAGEKELDALRKECDRQARELEQGRLLEERRGEDGKIRREHLEQDCAQLRQGEMLRDEQERTLEIRRTEQEKIAETRKRQEEELRTVGEALDMLHEEETRNTDRRHKLELQLVRMQGELKSLQDRIWGEYELTYAGAAEYRVQDFDLRGAERDIARMRGEIRAMGSINVNAIEEFGLTKERFDQLSAQRDDLKTAMADLERIITELLTKMDKRFRKQFAQLNEYFGKTFVKLFGGGYAELRLTDEQDVLNCGIDIVAQPPGKKLQLLSLLSGGERALTAIAILFSMLQLKPTPFCFLDEIEAALDEANVANFAEYLNQFSEKTQFVVVTHRRGTMERCQALYGVAMEEKGVSRMVSVRLDENA